MRLLVLKSSIHKLVYNRVSSLLLRRGKFSESMEIPVLLSLLIVGFGASTAEETEDAVTPLYFLSEDYIMKINTDQDEWEAGRNFDANTPLRDIQILMGTRMDNRNLHAAPMKTFDPEWPEINEIPKHFDARQKWGKKCPTIGQVLDQGMCGSCWAIAPAQAFSDRYCIASKGKHKQRLSTNYVMTCCSECGNGCYGGSSANAWIFFEEQGVVSGGNYSTTVGCQPYSIQSPCRRRYTDPYPYCPVVNQTLACHSSCTNDFYRITFNKDKRFAKRAYQLANDVDAIKRDIMTYGPVTTSFTVREDFISYKKGVYTPRPNSTTLKGHGVKIFGWGVEKNIPYWLVMNSWNPFWGDKGTIKMRMGNRDLNLESNIFAATAKIDK